jgi:uncharacterized surface protein with fasciclin (FAS1) repeats
MVTSDWMAELIIVGVIQVVDKLIQIPQTIGLLLLRAVLMIDWILGSNPDVSTFNSLFKKSSFPSSYSLFVPDNSSFETLHPVELSYLETHFGQHDRANLIRRHACNDVLYAKDLIKGGKVSSLEGENIHYRAENGDILVDDANITESDIVARNGNHLKAAR